MGKRLGILLVSATLLAAACGHEPYSSSTPGASAAPVRTLYTGLQCGHATRSPAIEEVAGAEQLELVYARLTRLVVAGQSATPEVFFDEEIVLLIGMGEQPTAGYSLAPGAATAPIRNGVAEVRVDWTAPAEGAMTAQMITSPCILIALGRGRYSAVSVVDQHGQQRLGIPVR